MITIVSGFGRCGSSLVMQMLNAGGMPCAGEYPAFEAAESSGHLGGASISAEWLASIPGHAVKILDPQNGRIPRSVCCVIWCSRDYHEQARSQAKFAAMFGMPVNRDTVRAFEESYRRDKPAAVKSLLRTGTSGIMEVRFDDLLRNPQDEARKIADYCCTTLDVEKMATQVRRRSPLCAPGMDMELTLIAERDAMLAERLASAQRGKG